MTTTRIWYHSPPSGFGLIEVTLGMRTAGCNRRHDPPTIRLQKPTLAPVRANSESAKGRGVIVI